MVEPERTIFFSHGEVSNWPMHVLPIDEDMKIYASPILDMTGMDERKQQRLNSFALQLGLEVDNDGNLLLLGCGIARRNDVLLLKRDEYTFDIEEGGDLHRLRRFIMAHEAAYKALTTEAAQPPLRIV